MKKEKGPEYLRKKTRRRMRALEVLYVLFAVAVVAALHVFAWFSSDTGRAVYNDISLYAKEAYEHPLKEPVFYASGLCVSDADVSLEGYESNENLENLLTASALFDTGEAKVLQGFNLYGPIHPASTTKLLTAYVALKYGNLEDAITVGEEDVDFPRDAQVCGLKENDEISLDDLLCGLLLSSGNDCARAIAGHISGSEEAFVDLMNKEAFRLGATGTHFVNSHGLHSDDHFTTAYDLYLIFSECMKLPRFNEIIAMDGHTAHIKDEKGRIREVRWPSTNRYSEGTADLPENLTGLGGKTGYTHEAGRCLVYSCKDDEGDIYISVVMGANNRDILYDQTNSLLSAGLSSKGGF